MKERERNPGIGNRRPLLQLWSQERNPAQTALLPLQILGEGAGYSDKHRGFLLFYFFLLFFVFLSSISFFFLVHEHVVDVVTLTSLELMILILPKKIADGSSG